jgi:hypothetical protein
MDLNPFEIEFFSQENTEPQKVKKTWKAYFKDVFSNVYSKTYGNPNLVRDILIGCLTISVIVYIITDPIFYIQETEPKMKMSTTFHEAAQRRKVAREEVEQSLKNIHSEISKDVGNN